MTSAEELEGASSRPRSGVPSRLYTGLTLIAGVFGAAIGVASIVNARYDTFFIPVLIFTMLVPFGLVATLGTLAYAAARGRGRGWFYASWLLAGVLLSPVAFLVYVLAFAVLVPIGLGAGIGALGHAAARDRGGAWFHVSWVLAGALLIPVAFFVYLLDFLILVPIVFGVILGALGSGAARDGGRLWFHTTWILGGILLCPLAFYVCGLVLGTEPPSLPDDLPQMGPAELIGLTSLVGGFVSLAAIVVAGFQVWRGIPLEKAAGLPS